MCKLSIALPVKVRDDKLWKQAAALWLALPDSSLEQLPYTLAGQIVQEKILIGKGDWRYEKKTSFQHCLARDTVDLAVQELGYWSSKSDRYAIPLSSIKDKTLLRYVRQKFNFGLPIRYLDALVVCKYC